MQPQIQTNGSWTYTLLEGALKAAGLETMETYIYRHQNTVAQYIPARPILDLCLEAERRPGLWVLRQWWEKAGLDFTGLR